MSHTKNVADATMIICKNLTMEQPQGVTRASTLE